MSGLRVWLGAVVVLALSVAADLSTGRAGTIEEARGRLDADVRFLAADDLEGRGVGTDGLNKAADFIQSEFQKAGLDVTRVNGGAFQKFDLVTGATKGPVNTLKLIAPDGTVTELELGKDFEVCSFGGSGKFDVDLAFAGYSIDAGKDGYSDFAGFDAKGKALLVMRRNPGQSASANPHGGNPHATGDDKTPDLTRHADLRRKFSQATQHEAAAIVFVNDPHAIREAAETRKEQIAKAESTVVLAAEAFTAADPANEAAVKDAQQKLTESVRKLQADREAAKAADYDVLMKFGYAGNGGEATSPLPAVHITQAIANKALEGSLGKPLKVLEAEIDSDLKPRSAILTGWKLQGEISVEQTRSEVKNVIGVLEGEGPLAGETIVIGAHYDHVGKGGANSLAPGSTEVHNGADDNASGTVALIELARHFGSLPQKPARRLVFIAFTAEELGLIGSARYVKEPVFPLESTIAMFNMDMVGRLQDSKLTIFGTGTSPRWEPELKALNETAKFEFAFKPEGFGPSDHSSFYGKQIPVLHFFTGTHPDYHRPSDDADKLNVEGIARVTALLEPLIAETAANPERPAYVEVKGTANPMRDGSRPYVGTIPDFGTTDPGYAISGAAPGSPADKAGLKAGDRIVKLGTNAITGLDDFDLALRKFKPGEETEFTIIRAGQEIKVKVTFAPPR